MENTENKTGRKIVDLFDTENNLNIIGEWIEEYLKSGSIGDLLEIIDIVNGNDYDKNIVWHYTKRDVLKKIFPPNGSEEYKKSKGNIRLRLLNTNDSSDQSEAKLFKPFLIKNKEKILENLKEVELCKDLKKDFEEWVKNKKNENKRIGSYIFSTSRLKDSHTFWNMEYAGLDGIAIGFEKEALKDILGNKVYDVLYMEHNENKGLVYDALLKFASDLTIEIYDMVLNKSCFKDTISRGYTPLSLSADIHSCVFKHRTWKNERETRILLSDTKDDEVTYEIELINKKDKKVHYEHLSKDVISSIMLGPKCNDDQVKKYEEYLDYNGYKGIPVSRSHAFDLKDTDL